MRKLPAFVLAAAAVFTIAGAPMTAQAATCSRSFSNCYTSNYNSSSCYGQSLNSLLSRYGCNNNSTGTRGALSYNNNNNCNIRQFASCYGNFR